MVSILRRTLGLLAVLAAVLAASAAERPVDLADPLKATRARGEAYAHLMRAMHAARSGEAGRAAEGVARAIELQPGSADLLVEGADILMLTGKRREAEQLARRALELSTDHPGALRFLADVAAARAFGQAEDAGARDEAIELYERLVRVQDPAEPRVLEMLTQLKIDAGDHAGALNTVRELVRQRPGDLRATQTMAQLLLRAGEEAEALRVMLRYLATHPDEESLMRVAEQFAARLQAWELVDEELSRAALGNGAAELHRLLAEARRRLGRWEGAAEALERARAADPTDLRTAQHLAQTYRAVGRLADAAELLDALVREKPDAVEYKYELARTLEAQRDLHGALRQYAEALDGLAGREGAAEARDELRKRMAALELAREDPAAARELLGALEVRDDPEGLELWVRADLATEDYEAARSAARRLEAAGEPALAALLEGEIAVREQRWSRAQSRFAEAVARLGAPARRRVAGVYVEAGRFAEAAETLREWVAQAPEDPDARYHLGDVLYRDERFDEAERQLREAFRLDPRHGPALNYLGYSFAERNVRLDEALELIQRALDVDAWNAAYLDSLGWVYYQMGRLSEARQPLERAARELPHDPTVLEHLGDLYLGLGQSEHALDAFRRALEAGPEDPAALESKIARLRLLDQTSGERRDPPVESRLDGPSPPRPH